MGHPWDILDENKGKRNTPQKMNMYNEKGPF